MTKPLVSTTIITIIVIETIFSAVSSAKTNAKGIWINIQSKLKKVKPFTKRMQKSFKPIKYTIHNKHIIIRAHISTFKTRYHLKQSLTKSFELFSSFIINNSYELLFHKTSFKSKVIVSAKFPEIFKRTIIINRINCWITVVYIPCSNSTALTRNVKLKPWSLHYVTFGPYFSRRSQIICHIKLLLIHLSAITNLQRIWSNAHNRQSYKQL